jgi:hypothetical protein
MALPCIIETLPGDLLLVRVIFRNWLKPNGLPIAALIFAAISA